MTFVADIYLASPSGKTAGLFLLNHNRRDAVNHSINRENMNKNDYFSIHPRELLKNWANRLGIFRYVRAQKPQDTLDQQGDELQCKFSYSSEKELLEFFSTIGVKPLIYEDEPKKPTIVRRDGRQVIDSNGCPFIIPGTQWIQQPGFLYVQGIPTNIWCEENYIKISGKAHSDWKISEIDVLNAEKLEAILLKSQLALIDPPVDNDHCLCPKYYPDLFS